MRCCQFYKRNSALRVSFFKNQSGIISTNNKKATQMPRDKIRFLKQLLLKKYIHFVEQIFTTIFFINLLHEILEFRQKYIQNKAREISKYSAECVIYS